MPVPWSEDIDRVIGGDLTAALAYVTPAGGAVATAVAPIGIRDRAAGTISFTTSLGFGRKLERIHRDRRIALAYHAREHGFADGELYVLAQGDAQITLEPDERYLREVVGPRAERFLGGRKSGLFWDRWLRQYYQDRVPVHVTVRRIAAWPSLDASGPPAAHGSPAAASPPSQSEPRGGVAPRVDAARAAQRCRALPHQLLAYRDAEGYPVVVPVRIGEPGAGGFQVRAAAGLLPPGARRAGLLAHGYEPQLIGLAARQLTGWMTVSEDGTGVYSPHTEQGFRAPANKTLLLLANGLLAKRGLREARRSGRLERLRAPVPGAPSADSAPATGGSGPAAAAGSEIGAAQ